MTRAQMETIAARAARLTREQKIQIMLETMNDHAQTIPGYLWEDHWAAADMAFRKIERLEKEEPQAGEAVRELSLGGVG